MDSLLLMFLLLGAAPDGPSVETQPSGSRAQAVASATILRGEVIDFDRPVSQLATKGNSNIFQIATIRSAGKTGNADGGEIQLQEFH
ncbi:hypothetical protein [Parasphingorhabdus sp.]|uniref:hypothetical protein n=1 Tax=Parasphingorhabdus sp. TaxID=2709688 RepID=UPI003C7362B9